MKTLMRASGALAVLLAASACQFPGGEPDSPAGAGGDVCWATANSPSNTGLVISKDFVRGELFVACAPSPPDTFLLTLSLIHDNVMLKPGSSYGRPPGNPGYAVETFAPCAPGVWQLYMLATWTYGGQVGSNPTTKLESQYISQKECDDS